jgi:anti-sigma-K factor RskA
MNCSELRELADLYLVGAVEPDVANAIDQHLAECEACRQHVAELAPSTEALSISVPSVAPPAALRQRLIETASAESTARHGAASEEGSYVHAELATLGSATSATALWARGPALFNAWPRLAVASVLVLLIMSCWLAYQSAELGAEIGAVRDELRAARHEIQRVRAYEQALGIMQDAIHEGGAMMRVDGTDNAPGARGMMYAPPNGRRGVLAVSGLPSQTGEGYQLWLIRGDTRTNGGYFEPEFDGKYLLVVDAPAPLEEFDAFGITNEQRGGSLTPQGKRYMWGRGKGT